MNAFDTIAGRKGISVIWQWGVLCGFLLLLCSCSSRRYLADGEYLLDKVSITSDTSGIDISMLSGYVRQQPNARWASIAKVPLGIYLMAGSKGKGSFHRFIRKMGEAPVVYDTLMAERSRQRIQDALFNMGYLHAGVTVQEKHVRHKVRVSYDIHPGQRYYVDSISVQVQDTALTPEIENIAASSLLEKGMPFDANVLNQERSRITGYLSDRGYYAFNREFIRFEADTFSHSEYVHLKMIVAEYTEPTDKSRRPHRKYVIGSVRHSYDRSAGSPLKLRDAVMQNACSLRSGHLYRESDVRDTYRRMSRLGAVAATNVRLVPNAADSSMLDADIIVTPARINSIQLGLDGTNTAGDLGAAVNFTYQNRNAFHGSEVFSLKLRTAFEAIRGLTGYADQNYFEYGIEAGLQFPDFVFPFLSREFRRRSAASSELSLTYASQDRPEFHRRVLNSAWKYRWNSADSRQQHRLEMLDVNYVFMPWISDTFYDTYIKNPESRNAIIAYNYKNLFIVRMGYMYQYSSIGTSSPLSIYGKNAYSLRIGAETAGNLIHGLCSLFDTGRNEDGQRTMFNIAYAQYAKFDFDVSKSIRLSERVSVATHFAFGIAYPYGNADILPYEKRYFSGGANSVRGWSIRGLGPGAFVGNDGNIDFINQTGDVKLDMSVELRMHLFWKFDGAAFIDAGNIWTLRDYKDQPGGQFRWDTCWEQIALAYGMGVRLNLNYFLLRFDAGMKAINPAYQDTKRHYPLIYPDFGRDFTFHFAVGLPF